MTLCPPRGCCSAKSCAKLSTAPPFAPPLTTTVPPIQSPTFSSASDRRSQPDQTLAAIRDRWVRSALEGDAPALSHSAGAGVPGGWASAAQPQQPQHPQHLLSAACTPTLAPPALSPLQPQASGTFAPPAPLPQQQHCPQVSGGSFPLPPPLQPQGSGVSSQTSSDGHYAVVQLQVHALQAQVNMMMQAQMQAQMQAHMQAQMIQQSQQLSLQLQQLQQHATMWQQQQQQPQQQQCWHP